MSQAITTIETDSSDRTRSTTHAGILLVAISIFVIAYLLEVRTDDRVAVRGWAQYPLPPTCQARAHFGIDCPGCGLTRSFVHLAHFDWRSSLRSHRFGWLLAGVVLFQIPYRALALRGRAYPLFSVRTVAILSYLLLAVLLGNWLFNLFASKHFSWVTG